jgi:hypothetical protein
MLASSTVALDVSITLAHHTFVAFRAEPLKATQNLQGREDFKYTCCSKKCCFLLFFFAISNDLVRSPRPRHPTHPDQNYRYVEGRRKSLRVLRSHDFPSYLKLWSERRSLIYNTTLLCCPTAPSRSSLTFSILSIRYASYLGTHTHAPFLKSPQVFPSVLT